VPRGFGPWCGPTQSSLAQPSLARAPPGPFLSFDFSRATTSLSLPSLYLSPRGALSFGDDDHQNLDPRGELPSPSLSSPPPPLSPSLRTPCPRRARPPAALESRLEGGVNRANLKFINLSTTTSRVSVRNMDESEREGEKQIAGK
jgi:hypothetical protein